MPEVYLIRFDPSVFRVVLFIKNMSFPLLLTPLQIRAKPESNVWPTRVWLLEFPTGRRMLPSHVEVTSVSEKYGYLRQEAC